jgi:hypothetical protein
VLCSAALADEFLGASDHAQPRDAIQRHRDGLSTSMIPAS